MLKAAILNTNFFCMQCLAEIAKRQMLSTALRLNFCYLEIIQVLHPCYYAKIREWILKNEQRNTDICSHEITQLIITKIKMKTPHRCNINTPRSRKRHKYSKYKKCLSKMVVICIKEYLSNIWSFIHEKVRLHWGWVKKSVTYKTKRVTLL